MENPQFDEYMSIIKSSVSMEMLCNFLGIPITRNRTIVCPFHGDSHPSCKIYDGDKGYYCFVCHQGGDVFNFAQNYFKTDYYHTLCELSPIIGLNLGESSKDSARLKDEQKERERIRNEKIEAEQRKLDEYHKWLDIYINIDKKLITKPNSIDEITDDMAKAMKNKAYVEYRLNLATDNLRKE